MPGVTDKHILTAANCNDYLEADTISKLGTGFLCGVNAEGTKNEFVIQKGTGATIALGNEIKMKPDTLKYVSNA